MKMINLRKEKRVNVTVGVSVRLNGRLVHGTSCSNISQGGMCIRFEGEPPVGDSGELWLTKQYEDEVISFESAFRRLWVKPVDIGSRAMRMGVRFIQVGAEDRYALSCILKREGDSSGC
ncbi:MAG: PilZ domain-containing protein [Chitinivibrionales bacterium]